MCAGSVTYPSASLKRDPGDTSPLPQNLVANLLSPRMRTISIPRPGPRATDLSGPFIHKSLTQAKECLSRVGEMVRSRTKEVVVSSNVGKTTVTSEEAPSTTAGSAGMKENVEDTASSYRTLTMNSFTGSFHQRSTIPEQQGQILERSDSPVNGQAVRIIASGSPSRVGSAHSPQTSAASAVHPSHSASSSRTATEGHSAGSGTRKGTAENRTGSGHRALSVRRHLSPRKKRELVKRLTEMAKCEAVDMSNPLGMQEEHGGESRFMPPMIILSQQRQEIRCPGDFSAETPAQHSPVDHGDIVEGGVDGGMHRAKSMSSLHHSNSHPYPGTSRDPPSQQQEDYIAEKPGCLKRAASGSMPDLVMEGGPPCSARNQRDMKRTDASDWAAAASHAFTEGIVGKTLLKEKESGDTVRFVESRPFVPFTPKYRSRRATRPSSRRSKIGLRDRGPPPDTSTVPSTTTTIFTLNPNKQNRFNSTPSTSQSSEHQPPPSPQNLPVLTITGLNRERPPPGTPSANSRAAREFRPTSRAGVTTSSLQFFQRLDDQCEKLQRQLNISLNMPPRRAPHWQTLSRADLPSHHQPRSFSLPYGVEDADASTSSNLVQPGPNPRQDPAGVPPLSDVDEQSHVNTIRTPYTHTIHRGLVEEDDTNDYDGSVLQNGLSGRSNLQNTREISTRTPLDKKGGGGSGPPPPRSEATDPVLQSKKEPRYQGFSSRVPESEVRSQFHYITPGSVAAESETAAAAAAEEEREMKYRVLKALDQDVYYDFQHRKYRNTPGSTPVVRCNNEEDRPRVHFYKVKVNGET